MTEPRDSEIRAHIAWLRTYVSDMSEANWRDTQLRLKRQIERLAEALDAALAECERQRERAGKAEEWNRLRALDIITLGQEVGKWQAAWENERERARELE